MSGYLLILLSKEYFICVSLCHCKWTLLMHTKKSQYLKWPLSWSAALWFLYSKTHGSSSGHWILQPELTEKGGGGIEMKQSSPVTDP